MTKLLFDMGAMFCEAAAVVLVARAASKSTHFVQDQREQNMRACTVGDGVRVGGNAEERSLTVGSGLDEGASVVVSVLVGVVRGAGPLASSRAGWPVRCVGCMLPQMGRCHG
jgi:hypothetical protein